jgi:hypothetical protein
LLVLLAGNIAWPHTWWWSVSGTSLYALGTGLLFPVLFRFALFSHSLPKGTVSATINIVALSFMAASALGLLPGWRQNCFSLPGADSGNRRHHAGLALVKTPSTTSPSASLKV